MTIDYVRNRLPAPIRFMIALSVGMWEVSPPWEGLSELWYRQKEMLSGVGDLPRDHSHDYVGPR